MLGSVPSALEGAATRLALACALLSSACTVDDIDVSGKGCSAEAPCPDGLSCVAGICRKEAQQSCTPSFTVEGFKRAWATPHTLRWSWTPQGTADDFVQYKLVLAEREDELEAAVEKALSGDNDGLGGEIWTQEDNPELGQYELRLSQETDLITATTTDGLTPAREYRARLLAYDSAGCVFKSATAVGQTNAESLPSYVIFDDAPNPSGTPRPFGIAELKTDPSLAYEGDTFLHWAGWPDDGSVADGAWENIGIAALDTDPSAYPLLDFSAAYLELALAIDGPELAAWGEVRFMIGEVGDCSGAKQYKIEGYVFRPGGAYHVLELPLSQFGLTEKLSADTLNTKSICEVSLGRRWSIGESVRIDALRLRW